MDSKGQIFDDATKAPEDSFEITPQEKHLLEKVAEADRADALVNIRFAAWVAYNKLKLSTIEKIKMRAAFRAGFMSKKFLNKLSMK